MTRLPTTIALEVFLRGFSTTRSFTKPFLVSQPGSSVWLLSDPPGTKNPRSAEFIAYGAHIGDVLKTVENVTPARHAVCVLIDNADELPSTVAEYKAHGYRYHGREPLFVLDLDERVTFNTYPVRRVVAAEDAAKLAKAARSRQIYPEHLGKEDRICRLYAAFDGDTPIGWVRSIRTHPDCSWVSTMYVDPSHRRKGIGKTLLSAMLDDDHRFGVQWSVLLASLTGALLYPHIGYQEQGLLLIFNPVRAGSKSSKTSGQ